MSTASLGSAVHSLCVALSQSSQADSPGYTENRENETGGSGLLVKCSPLFVTSNRRLKHTWGWSLQHAYRSLSLSRTASMYSVEEDGTFRAEICRLLSKLELICGNLRLA